MEVGEHGLVVEAADLDGKVLPIGFGGFQGREGVFCFAEMAGVEGVFHLEIEGPGSIMWHAVDTAADFLDFYELLRFFFQFSRRGVVHHKEGGTAESETGRYELVFQMKFADVFKDFGKEGGHGVQMIEGGGPFEKGQGCLPREGELQPLDAGHVPSIAGMKFGEIEVVGHEKHCFHVLLHQVMGNVVQKVGRIDAGPHQQNGVGAFVQNNEGELIVFRQAGKSHGFGEASHGIVPVGRLIQVLPPCFFAPELEFGLEKFLHQGKEEIFAGLPI